MVSRTTSIQTAINPTLSGLANQDNAPKSKTDVPKDWSLARLADFGVFQSGNGFPLAFQGLETGDFPFFKVSDMNNDGNGLFMKNANHWISESVARSLAATRFQPGSIVFAKIGAAIFLERKRLLTRESCLDNNMMAFTLFDKHACHRFFYYLLENTELGKLVSATALPSLSGKQLGDIVVAIPPPREQRAIAEALSDVDELLGSLDALIAKKRSVKQAAMQDLLTGKTRLPKFRDEWNTARIGDLLDYERPDHYIVRSAEYSENGNVPVLTANKSFVLGFTDETFGVYSDVPAIVFDDFTTDCKYAERPFKVKSSAIKILKPKHDQVSLRYVFERMQLLRFVPGIHKRHYIAEYQNIALPVPDYDEQVAIASALSDMDAEFAALERRRAKSLAIKQGMMQELLSGRIRL